MTRRVQSPSTELGRRQPDDIRRQVKVLTDANGDHQLQLNRLQDELLRQTTSVVHVGSNTFLEQDRNWQGPAATSWSANDEVVKLEISLFLTSLVATSIEVL